MQHCSQVYHCCCLWLNFFWLSTLTSAAYVVSHGFNSPGKWWPVLRCNWILIIFFSFFSTISMSFFPLFFIKLISRHFIQAPCSLPAFQPLWLPPFWLVFFASLQDVTLLVVLQLSAFWFDCLSCFPQSLKALSKTLLIHVLFPHPSQPLIVICRWSFVIYVLDLASSPRQVSRSSLHYLCAFVLFASNSTLVLSRHCWT